MEVLATMARWSVVGYDCGDGGFGLDDSVGYNGRVG